MRKHMVSLAIVTLVVAGAVAFVGLTPAHRTGTVAHAAGLASAADPRPDTAPTAAKPATAAAKTATAAAKPGTAADPDAPPTPVFHSAAEAQAALARLTPAERARLEPVAKAFMAALRQAGAKRAAEAGAKIKGHGSRVWNPDAKGVLGAMMASRPQLTACYEAWLKVNPTAGGEIDTTFHIGAPKQGGPPGIAEVTEVRVTKDGVGTGFLDGCILFVLSHLRFHPPASKHGLTVDFPWRFLPGTTAGKTAGNPATKPPATAEAAAKTPGRPAGP